ncbi:hypothetical protein Acy02nite_51400 [Actinoplanes cyaneus]|uniref:Uncharacterized protein n=1 Tax=Actinoplanes cyaneus TaxID=52696 RepID=A0A919IK16_9ACTN|nr:hypothetical protein Acy02nite_51400 [Actinoplanes cyaneus]
MSPSACCRAKPTARLPFVVVREPWNGRQAGTVTTAIAKAGESGSEQQVCQHNGLPEKVSKK